VLFCSKGKNRRMSHIPILQNMCKEPISHVTMALAQQYAGWRNDYIGAVTGVLEEDAELLVQAELVAQHIIHEEIEASKIVNQYQVWIRLAQLLSEHDCMGWLAINPESRTVWHPLVQSYHNFKSTYPECEPYLGTETVAASTVEQLVQFFEQHGQPF
jgi:hypothetical protein